MSTTFTSTNFSTWYEPRQRQAMMPTSWRDPATDRHSRAEALKTAGIRYWMDHADD